MNDVQEPTADNETLADDVKPGMAVEASQGDLGEHDISQAHVTDVVRDRQGHVEDVIVKKGLIFKKVLEVPPDRIQSVESPSSENDGKGALTIAASEDEVAALSATGAETLAAKQETPQSSNLLGEVEEELPTITGLRRLEAESARKRSQQRSSEKQQEVDAAKTGTGAEFSWRDLGPGFLAGMAGNDSSAVTSYSINGATNGYGQLWLLLLATPLYQAVQYACAKVGRVTQRGLAEILREHYGRKVAVPASLILITANTALIAADLVAIGSGLELLTGLAWEWFVAPIAAILWYLTVYQSFEVIKRIFLVMSLVFVAYLVTGLFSGANWGLALKDTFVPQIGFNLASISSAVALLGATVSPYTMYWQAQGEKEEQRAGKPKQQMRAAALDIAAGTLSGNLVAYAIIVCTSATLFTHHQSIASAADAARSLEPLLGPYAKYLFAIGFIGAGLVAIPVLLASTSYAVSGTFGWSASLWKKPWQNEGFYLILTGALGVSLALALVGLNPIQLMFWANVLQGVLSPVLIIFILLVGNNRKVMRSFRLGRLTNIGLVAIALIMVAATVLLFYGIATGHGS